MRAGAAAASLLDAEHHPSSRGGAPQKAPFGSRPRSWNWVWAVPETPPSGQSTTVPSLGYEIRSSTPPGGRGPGSEKPEQRPQKPPQERGRLRLKHQTLTLLASVWREALESSKGPRSAARAPRASATGAAKRSLRAGPPPWAKPEPSGRPLGDTGKPGGHQQRQGAANAAPTSVRDQRADRSQKTQKPGWPGDPKLLLNLKGINLVNPETSSGGQRTPTPAAPQNTGAHEYQRLSADGLGLPSRQQAASTFPHHRLPPGNGKARHPCLETHPASVPPPQSPPPLHALGPWEGPGRLHRRLLQAQPSRAASPLHLPDSALAKETWSLCPRTHRLASSLENGHSLGLAGLDP